MLGSSSWGGSRESSIPGEQGYSYNGTWRFAELLLLRSGAFF